MATVSPQNVLNTGVLPVYTAVTASDTLVNNGNSFLHVKNGGAGSTNVTIISPTFCNQGVEHDLVVAVPNGSERMIGPFPIGRFGQSVTVNYSVTTTVTAALIATPA